MKNLSLFFLTLGMFISGLIVTSTQAALALTFRWSYSAPGIAASGTLTTEDSPDEAGFFLVTDITGTRNGETITGLVETGTSVPGNEPFEVDNLISLHSEQLTIHGIGYGISDGSFVNIFFTDSLEPPGYYEFFSAPPIMPGYENLGPDDTELPVSFSASREARI